MNQGVQSQPQPSPSWGEIGGKQWQIQSDGDGIVAQRVLRPGVRPGHDVHVTSPHPDPELRRWGFRVAWLFLTAMVCIGIGAWFLMMI